MNTEFELSSRLVVWGNELEPTKLAELLGIDSVAASIATKGSPLFRSDGTPSGSVAKTGRLTVTFDKIYPDSRGDPETQLAKVAEILRSLGNPIMSLRGVEKAQLQLFFYYEVELAGEPDFVVPDSLIPELARHKLSFRITILP